MISERKERRPAHFLHRAQDDVVGVALASVRLPLLQFLVGLLHHHDGRVHQRACRDGDSRPATSR